MRGGKRGNGFLRREKGQNYGQRGRQKKNERQSGRQERERETEEGGRRWWLKNGEGDSERVER